MATSKRIKAAVEFRFWYPANLEPEPEAFAELALLVPKKKRRQRIIPVGVTGHITMNKKIICPVSKKDAQKAAGCDGGKTVGHSLPGARVCPKCIELYSGMYTSEIRKLKVWTDGGFKVF